MNSRQRNLLFGGALVAGSVAGAFYLFTKNKEKAVAKPVNELSREMTIKILKHIQRDMFALLSNISANAAQIKEQFRGQVDNAQIKEFLFHKHPSHKAQMKQITEKIYEKYGIDENDLKHACEVTYKDDREIKQLLNEAKTSFDKAFSGNSLDLRTEIPAMLTPELTLRIHRRIMKEILSRLQAYWQGLRDRGVPVSHENPEILMGLQNLKLEDIRVQVIEEEGLDQFEEAPLKIFQFATQKYTTENPNGFTQKFHKLNMQNQKIAEAVMKGSPEAPTLIENLGAHLDVVEEKVVVIKKEEVNVSKEESSVLEPERIHELKRQLSSKIQQSLEESEFPQNLVESAMQTVLRLLENMDKPESLKNSGIHQKVDLPVQEEEKQVEQVVEVVEVVEVQEVRVEVQPEVLPEVQPEAQPEVQAEVPVEVSTVVVEEKPEEVIENVEQEEKPVESEVQEEGAEENQE